MDVDLILIPESGSSLSLDMAKKIKNKIPNANFVNNSIIKNIVNNISLDYDKLREKNYNQETILQLENMIKKSVVDGVFKIKKNTSKIPKIYY